MGKLVGQIALARGAKYQLEMGGKNPVIVLKDADLDLAVEATVSGGLRSTGQKCTATSRVIVESAVYDQFKEKLLARVSELKVGNGLEDGTWMGPCANKKQQEKFQYYVQKGLEEGAVLLCGGKVPQGDRFRNGFYVEPTVFENVNPHSLLAQEEIFVRFWP